MEMYIPDVKIDKATIVFLLSAIVLLAALFRTLALSKTCAKPAGTKTKAVSDSAELKTLLPPSRRQALLATRNPDPKAEEYRQLLAHPTPPVAVVQANQIPTGTPLSALSKSRQYYTITGFSSADVEALGRFPDYSILSSVPPPKPCPEFDIKTACFRPYRPFRWVYHQTMALSKLEPDYWIELEQNYFETLKQRKALLAQHGTKILNYSPGTELACRELMEMVLQFVCTRYPHYFSLENSNTIFINRLLNTTTDLTTSHPLNVLFDNIPEDFPIMMRDENDGNYYLRAGFICSSIGWTFGTHFNRPLRAIHTEVNDYDKMAKSMDRFFTKLPTDQPIQRGAWFIEDWKPLFVTPEEYALNAGTRHQGETVPIEQCYLRVDWQTLRRLPLSGAIVFNFKAVFTPMVALREEPYVPALLYKQVTEGKRVITEPKVHGHLLPVVLVALERWKGEQVEKGLVERDWEVETLKESPFFPGWEDIWKRRGGLGFL
ncbi:hypothetical protein BJY04DRAFT_213690 [Aspergillus karnatakaensis]|uniref:heme-dependent oxidative N-demethylase family protein n=1 Tax=Aspergillus karnatakaensis TaxID=1810916 RepID=UPI003CCCBD75